MAKKIGFLILVLGIGVFAFLNSSYAKDLLSEKNISQDSVSDRSREFMESQGTSDPLWGNTQLEANETAGPTTVNIDDCFTIVVPYQIAIERKDGECNYHIGTQSPKANIITSLKPMSRSFEEDTGITLRRTRSETYEEYSQTIGGRYFIIFIRNDSIYERQAFTQIGSNILTVSIEGRTAKDLTDDFHKMLESIEIL